MYSLVADLIHGDGTQIFLISENLNPTRSKPTGMLRKKIRRGIILPAFQFVMELKRKRTKCCLF